MSCRNWLGLIDPPERCPACGGPPVARVSGLPAEYLCAAGHCWHRCGSCQRPVRGASDPTRTLWDHLCPACRSVHGGPTKVT